MGEEAPKRSFLPSEMRMSACWDDLFADATLKGVTGSLLAVGAAFLLFPRRPGLLKSAFTFGGGLGIGAAWGKRNEVLRRGQLEELNKSDTEEVSDISES